MSIIEIIDDGNDFGSELRFICIEDKQRRADLAELLRRGLNTWIGCPAWLLELQDELKAIEAADKAA